MAAQGAHHVSAPAADLRQQSEYSSTFSRRSEETYRLPILELEKETFDIMWELSTPGGEAEGCFLRAPQTEYYTAKEGNPDLLSFYPDVRKFYSIIKQLTLLISI
jgi:hypothetical protein